MPLPDLDPQIAALLAAAAADPQPHPCQLGPQGLRERFRRDVAAARPPGWTPEPVAAVVDRTVPGPAGQIPVRCYRPSATPGLPLLVYFHGGGWVIGDLETHDAQARLLANAVEAVVVSVDYRLAPEHPYPAALEDAIAAITWAAAHAGELDADPERLAVAGDSAGGNLAAALTLWARDHDGPAIAAQCLLYPVTDLRPDEGSWRAFASGTGLDDEEMAWFNDCYAGDADRDDPYLAPLRASDLSGLPPAVVATASHDILRDQGEAYARRLADAGVEVVARRYDGLVHSFFRYGDRAEAARRANDEICTGLRDLLHRP